MTARANPYPAAIYVLIPALALLLAPSGSTIASVESSSSPSLDRGFDVSPRQADAAPVNASSRIGPLNVTNLISDGTFDAIPGPWRYSNGTTGVVTAERDATARAQLGAMTSVFQFDSMDDIFGPNPWVSVVSNPGDATSNLTQETAVREQGNGSMRDDVTILKNGNKWGGAVRDDPLPWNWTGYDRLALRMNKASPAFVWGWVYAEDGKGGTAFGFFTLVAGWFRYAFDLNTTLDLADVELIRIVFSAPVGTPVTVYVDDIVLYNSTAFAETAQVSQTFTKSTPTGSSSNSLGLTFVLEATPSLNVVSYLNITIDGAAAWYETPVSVGTRTVYVDLSGNAALQGTGNFTLAFSLRLNRTGWEEAAMTSWIDNVTLAAAGALSRIVITPSTAAVPVSQTALFTAEGQDIDGNPVPLTQTSWSSTIGQIVAANATVATFQAPPDPGAGVVVATEAGISGIANVTIDPWGTPRINGVVPDQIAREDAAPWAVDLTPFAANQVDPTDTLDNLKWYLTYADAKLYTVFGENTFGRHDLVFSPRPDASGTDEVTLWLEDRDGARTGQALRVDITPVNDQPSFVAVPEIPLAYDEAYRFDFRPYIEDIDTPAANLILTTEDPAHIGIDGLNATYLYGKNLNGRTLFVRHFVTDGEASAETIVTVRVTDNSPPRLKMPLPNLAFPEDTVLRDAFPESLRAYFDDREGTQLFFSYNFTNLVVWINDTGTKVTVDVAGVPNFFGRDRITFRGTDPSGAFAEYTVQVDVAAVNDPPVLAWTDDVYVRFNRTYRLDLSPYVSDVDNDFAELTLTTSDPQGAAVQGFVVAFFYPQSRLGPDPVYVVPVNLSLSDGQIVAAREIDVHVSNNRPPELVVPLAALSFNEDQVQAGAIYLDRNFVDPDGGKLRYAATGQNVAVSIAGDKVTLTPDSNWFGQEVLVFRATDSSEAFALGYALVNVLPVNDPPQIQGIPSQVRSDAGLWILDLRPYVTDVDTDLSQLIFSTNSPYVEAVGFLLVFNFPNTNVETVVTVTVSDAGLTDTAVVTVRIAPVSIWSAIFWPGSALAAVAAAVAFVVIRQLAARVFRIEDLFLISREGLLIAHTTHRAEEHGDEDILAGMLTAIMSFAQDSFKGEREGLKRFEIGNRKVALERSEHVYVAVIGSGVIRNSLSTSLRQFLADIEGRYGDELPMWSGVIDDLPGVSAMMEAFARRGRYRQGDWRRQEGHGPPKTPTSPMLKEEASGTGDAVVPEGPLRPV